MGVAKASISGYFYFKSSQGSLRMWSYIASGLKIGHSNINKTHTLWPYNEGGLNIKVVKLRDHYTYYQFGILSWPSPPSTPTPIQLTSKLNHKLDDKVRAESSALFEVGHSGQVPVACQLVATSQPGLQHRQQEMVQQVQGELRSWERETEHRIERKLGDFLDLTSRFECITFNVLLSPRSIFNLDIVYICHR